MAQPVALAEHAAPRPARELSGRLARELARSIHRSAVEPLVEATATIEARARAVAGSRRTAWYLDILGATVFMALFVLAAVLV